MYRIADDNKDGAADVFIDGALVFSNLMRVAPLYDKRMIETGDVQDNNVDNGHALYAHISFEILPEPSTALLLLVAGAFSLRRRRQPV